MVWIKDDPSRKAFKKFTNKEIKTQNLVTPLSSEAQTIEPFLKKTSWSLSMDF